MTEQKRNAKRLAAAAAVLALTITSACGDRNRTARAPVDYKGSAPGGTTAVTPPPQVAPGTGGIVERGGASYVYAEEGDTVATLAARNGLSASELAGYNGLTPDSRLHAGQDLVLPPGAGATATVTPGTGAVAPVTPGTIDGRIEERDLPAGDGTAGVPVGPDGTVLTPPGAPPSGAPATGWTPDIAAAAIDAASGGSGGVTENGRLGAPPSSTDPVPPEPTGARDLASPGLGQYQTRASSGDPAASAPEPAERVAAADPARTGGSAPNLRLIRPVDGPVAVGFGEGSGSAKNDGVDFAAPAGAPVVAAADGEGRADLGHAGRAWHHRPGPPWRRDPDGLWPDRPGFGQEGRIHPAGTADRRSSRAPARLPSPGCISRSAAARPSWIRCSSFEPDAGRSLPERPQHRPEAASPGRHRGGDRCLAGRFLRRILAEAQPAVLHLIDPWRTLDDDKHATALYGTERGIDMDAVHLGVAERFAGEIADGRVVVHRALSAEAMAGFDDGSLDFVYVDGDHAHDPVREDLEFALVKVRPGGIIALDDYRIGGWWGDDVVRATNGFIGDHRGEVTLGFAFASQVVLVRR